jgi:hypothetical protein
MKSNLKTLLLIIFTCYSCNNNKTKDTVSPKLPYIIDIEKSISDKKEISLSSIGKKLEYIPLETKPECMLSNARNIAMTESFIFVSDGEKLIEFDKTGKYISQIGRPGRGPEEYLGLYDFCVDESTGRVYLLDEMALKVYDFGGRFIESDKLPFLSMLFTFNNNNSLIYYPASSPASLKDTLYSWYVTDLHGGITKKYINYHKRIKGRWGLATSPLFLLNNEPRFLEFGSDTLLYFKDDKPSPYAIFNFGALKMDPDPVTTRDASVNTAWPQLILEDKTRLYIDLNWGLTRKTSKCIYNKLTNETITSDNGFANDIDMGLPFWPKYIYQDSILVDQTDALTLIKRIKEIKSGNPNSRITEQLELLSQQLTENSNPVLIVLK